MATIVIAVVRGGVRGLLELEPGWEVVAEAGDPESALACAADHQPDVLVLDLDLPGSAGLDLLAKVAGASPGTAVVVLTGRDDPEPARRLRAAGAKAWLAADAADSELVDAVARAARGETQRDPGLGSPVAGAAPEPQRELSPRETEVLRLIALGHTNAEIAEQLFLSVRTVETHRSHIQQKLGTSTRAQLVRYALDHGLLSTG